MKNSILLSLFLLFSGTAPVINTAKHAQAGGHNNDAPAAAAASIHAFWQKFKAAVTSGKKAAVSNLSGFPIQMSYGIKSVKAAAELQRRFHEVFNEQSDAARCFAKKQPELDPANRKRFTVACPNDAGEEVVIYEFALTRKGWKFVALDNINE